MDTVGPGTDISYKYTASSGCQQEEKEIICQVTGKPETNKIIKLALRQNGGYLSRQHNPITQNERHYFMCTAKL